MINNNLSDRIANLYNAIFNKIDIIFLEHKFKLKSNYWESASYLTGQPHQRHDKIKVYKKGDVLYISEQGGETLSLIDYVINTRGGNFNEAFNFLANFTNVEKIEAKNTLKTSTQRSDKSEIYNFCNNFFKYNLLQTQSDKAKKALTYLNSRGYNLEEIKFCEFGIIENLDTLKQKLEQNGFKLNDIEEALRLDSRTKTNHFLTLPYIYNKKIQGFKFRTVEVDIKPKYLNTYNLPKEDNFFNFNSKNFDFKKCKSLIIVEGELDCLTLAGAEFQNVGAVGGNTITDKQIEVIKNSNFEQIFLFLDIEANNKGLNNIKRNIYKVIEVNQSVFIVDFKLNEKEMKQDPASLLMQYGRDKVAEAIANSKHYFDYLFEKLIQVEEPTSEADKEALLNKSITLISTVKNEIHKDNLTSLIFNHLAKFNIVDSLEVFRSELKRIDKLNLSKDLDNFKYKASKTTINNLDSLNALKQDLNELAEATNINNFKDLFKHTTKEEVFKSFQNQPKSLDTGFILDDKTCIILPAGGLSFVAAPTGHGKTTFLINVVLNALKKLDKQECIYFFTYEETKENIILYMLNAMVNSELNNFNNNNRDILKEYFKCENMNLIKDDIKDSFEIQFKELFTNLLETKKVNVIYTDYSVETLVNAIKYTTLSNYKPGLILIDYIQLMHSDTAKAGTRQEEVKNICLQLKNLAISIKAPILLGTQFNRQVKAPNDLHANNLGEAGDIERIASLIISFFNNMYLEQIQERTDTLSVKILKNRGGRNGTTGVLNIDGNHSKITNIEQKLIINNSDELPF